LQPLEHLETNKKARLRTCGIYEGST
jgi:hypothetical protein